VVGRGDTLILEILKAADRAAFVFKGLDGDSNGLF
jgi:hypothetical protein